MLVYVRETTEIQHKPDDLGNKTCSMPSSVRTPFSTSPDREMNTGSSGLKPSFSSAIEWISIVAAYEMVTRQHRKRAKIGLAEENANLSHKKYAQTTVHVDCMRNFRQLKLFRRKDHRLRENCNGKQKILAKQKRFRRWKRRKCKLMNRGQFDERKPIVASR